MKKILWFLSVVLVLLLATGAYAGTRSDKCNTYSNDLAISAVLDSYSGCLINISLLDKDVKLPYSAIVAGGPDPADKRYGNPKKGKSYRNYMQRSKKRKGGKGKGK